MCVKPKPALDSEVNLFHVPFQGQLRVHLVLDKQVELCFSSLFFLCPQFTKSSSRAEQGQGEETVGMERS